MGLSVIGAGLGRTGTLSLRAALGVLGLPCYHMFDLLFDPEHRDALDFWLGVAEDPDRGDRDWDRVFGRNTATVDFPGSAAWRGLVAAFPSAKVILTTHPAGMDAWYDSAQATIYQGVGLEAHTDFGEGFNRMMDRLVWGGLMRNTMRDRAAAIARHHVHLEEVMATVAADRLLVYSVDQGWGPLCDFLEVRPPQMPFPRLNDRDEMGRRMHRLSLVRSLTERGAAA